MYVQFKSCVYGEGAYYHCLFLTTVDNVHCLKDFQIRNFFSGLYFLAFGLNIVNLRIQSKCGKIWTIKNPVLGHLLTHFQPMFYFYTPWSGTMVENRLKSISNKTNANLCALFISFFIVIRGIIFSPLVPDIH